jgi:drug/metabolite transporter (DMT)-like permease
MLGDALLNAVHRATATAVENVERKVAWTAAGGAFLVCALVSALIVAYQLLQVHVGTLNAVAVISAACALIGLLCVSLPNMIDNAQRRQVNASPSASPVATTVAAIDEEAKQAVDYFGALRLVGAAFYFGLGAARKLKRRGPRF